MTKKGDYVRNASSIIEKQCVKRFCSVHVIPGLTRDPGKLTVWHSKK